MPTSTSASTTRTSASTGAPTAGPPQRTQVSLRAVTLAYQHRTVLDALTVAFPVGAVCGLIGENGSGKSTLLRVLAGHERPDTGIVSVHADGDIGFLTQEAPWPPDWTVADAVADACAALHAAQARMRELEAAMAAPERGPGRAGTAEPIDLESLLADYGEATAAFERHGGYEIDARLGEAFAALAIPELADGGRHRLLVELSGGQRRRVQLALLIVATPAVLLLDEPTNDLDDSAAAWLAARLRARPADAVTVVACHDRAFLDDAAGVLFDLEGGRARRFAGTYTAYRQTLEAERARAIETQDQWESDVAAARDAAATTARQVAHGRARRDGNKMAYDRAGGRVQASVAGRIRQAEERLRRLLADPPPPPVTPLRLNAHPTSDTGSGVPRLVAHDLAVTGRLAPVSLDLRAGEHLLVIGANGTGKTTLLDVLAGEVAPTTGTIDRRGRIGYLRQHPTLDPDATVLETYTAGRGGSTDDHAGALLATGLFRTEDLHRVIGLLSTGGRRRVELARLLTDRCEVLLLDEPTNHLSPVLADDLSTALAAFDGPVLLVSHDRRLRENWTGPTLTLPGAAR